LDVKGSINATGNLYIGGNKIYDSGGVLRISLGDTTSIGASLLSLGGNLKIGGNNIQDSGGIIRITLGNPVLIPSGTSLNVDDNTLFVDAFNHRVGIGTASPLRKLDVVGDINATGSLFVGGNKIYDSGGILRISLGDIINAYANLFNISGNLMVFGNNIQSSDGINRITLGNPININANINLLSGYNLQIAGVDVIDTNRNIINVNWVNASNFNASNLICLGGICKNSWPSSSLVGGSGVSGQVAFWSSSDTISGDNQLYWDNENKKLGIGTNVPSEKLEVQGRVLVASSNPFELEPSDQILDVKGSINATVVIFVPRQSSQPFACDATKAGAMFYNTTDNKFYGCNSTNWVIIGG
jgi:hypothetical protein